MRGAGACLGELRWLRSRPRVAAPARAGRLVAVAIGLGLVLGVDISNARRRHAAALPAPVAAARRAAAKRQGHRSQPPAHARERHRRLVPLAMEQKQFYDGAKAGAATRRLCVSGEWRVTELGPSSGAATTGAGRPRRRRRARQRSAGRDADMRAPRGGVRQRRRRLQAAIPIHLHRRARRGKDEFKFAASEPASQLAHPAATPQTRPRPRRRHGGSDGTRARVPVEPARRLRHAAGAPTASAARRSSTTCAATRR